MYALQPLRGMIPTLLRRAKVISLRNKVGVSLRERLIPLESRAPIALSASRWYVCAWFAPLHEYLIGLLDPRRFDVAWCLRCLLLLLLDCDASSSIAPSCEIRPQHLSLIEVRVELSRLVLYVQEVNHRCR